MELVYRAATVHRTYNDSHEVQVCTLLSIKTGGCSEDCSYCPQAARYHTDVTVQALMKKDEVLSYAQKAKEAGSTRFVWALPGAKYATTATSTAYWKW